MSIHATFGWPRDIVIVLFVGKLISRKRPFDLLDACHGLDCAVLFVGDGELRPALEDAIRARGMRAAITGFVNQSSMPNHYGASDVFVLPSKYEPWGLATNEAMACGLPVIVSSGCACATDLVDGNGFIYPAGDIETLRACLRLLLEPADAAGMRARRSQRSREIIARFSFEEDVKGILAALEALR